MLCLEIWKDTFNSTFIKGKERVLNILKQAKQTYFSACQRFITRYCQLYGHNVLLAKLCSTQQLPSVPVKVLPYARCMGHKPLVMDDQIEFIAPPDHNVYVLLPSGCLEAGS